MTQDLFPDDLAAKFAERARTAYRPSNGTEGEMFMERWCYHCVHEQTCGIILKTLLFDVEDLEYPGEWQYGTNGQPKCTAFERKPE